MGVQDLLRVLIMVSGGCTDVSSVAICAHIFEDILDHGMGCMRYVGQVGVESSLSMDGVITFVGS